MSPLQHMTVRPYGDEDLADAFVDCVRWAATEKEVCEAFQKSRPDIAIPPPARDPMSALIDRVTGVNTSIGGAFMDFVAEYVWGMEFGPLTKEESEVMG